jgi:hypothetical protein
MKISSPKAINWTLKQYGYTKNINSIFSRLIHGTTSAHSIVVCSCNPFIDNVPYWRE